MVLSGGTTGTGVSGSSLITGIVSPPKQHFSEVTPCLIISLPFAITPVTLPRDFLTFVPPWLSHALHSYRPPQAAALSNSSRVY